VFAQYFSRAPIHGSSYRFALDETIAVSPAALRHIGIYAYRAGFLETFSRLAVGELEMLEGLEQLRVLHAGHAIAVGISPVGFPPGVDTEADLLRAERQAALA
jgi:3-deoxy-manno-octulosonate cytidylyltransferase (CMP-KDO synthetase)